MKIFKKSISLAIALIMIVSSMYGNIANADTIPDDTTMVATPDPGYNPIDYPGYGSQGHVRMTKSAKWVDKENGIADITFNVSGTPVKQGIDAILILDRSGSMGGGSYSIDPICVNPEHKNETCGGSITWVNDGGVSSGLFYESQNKLGTCEKCGTIYRFTSERTWFLGWSSWSTPEPTICTQEHKDAQGNYISEGSTGCVMANTRLKVAQQAAKNFVNTMFEKEADGSNSPHRVGMISFSSSVSDTYNSPLTDASGISNITSKINGLVANGGTNYNSALAAAKQMLDGRTDKTRPAYIVFMTDGMPDPSDKKGRTEADALKTGNKATIYSVGLMMDSSYYGNLQYISSDPDEKYFYPITDPSVLGNVYTDIANQVKIAGTKAVLTDNIQTINFNGTVVSAVASTGPASVTLFPASGKVSWNIGDITKGGATLTIRVKLKDGKLSERGLIETNSGSASITYTNFRGVVCTQKVDSPKIPRYACSINIEYYLVDDIGNPISKDSGIGVVDWKNREVLNTQIYTDSNGNQLLQPNVPYSVKASIPIFTDKNNTVYSYVAESAGKGGNPTKTSSPVNVTITEEGKSVTVHFGYKRTENVRVTFDKNHSDSKGWTDAVPNTIDVTRYTAIKTMPTSPTRAGYIFDGWSTEKTTRKIFDPKSIITANTTLYAQWVKDPSQWYTITFLPGTNGKFSTGAKTIFTDILKDTPWNEVITVPGIVPDKGYMLKGWSGVFPEKITSNLTFTAQWEKDPSKWHTVTFKSGDNGTLEGQTIFTDILVDTAWDSVITVPVVNEKAGYKFSGWSGEFPKTITEDLLFVANINRSQFNLIINYIYSGGATFNTYSAVVNVDDPYSVTSPIVNGWTTNKLVVSGTMPNNDLTVDVFYTKNKNRLYNNTMYKTKVLEPINSVSSPFSIVEKFDYTFGFKFKAGKDSPTVTMQKSGDTGNYSLSSFKLYEGGTLKKTAATLDALMSGVTIESGKTYIVTYNIKADSINKNLTLKLIIDSESDMEYEPGVVNPISITSKNMPVLE